ncbi:MAG: hypothetical protein PHV57_10450 [Methanomicrobiaceae archaeon]|nr:hypothetical protein [Methanomicrobiaceae archaeon]
MTVQDEERIISHLRELNGALSDRERYRAVSYEDLEKSRDTRNMVFFALLISIQAMIDIADHLIAGADPRRPSTCGRVLRSSRIWGCSHPIPGLHSAIWRIFGTCSSISTGR